MHWALLFLGSWEHSYFSQNKGLGGSLTVTAITEPTEPLTSRKRKAWGILMKVNHSARAKTKMQALLYSLEDTRNWIIQADTKGGFLLTINGLVAGVMVQQIARWFGAMERQALSGGAMITLSVMFAFYLLAQLYSLWHTVQTFVPRTPASETEQTARTRHVFNYSISLHFPKLSDLDRLYKEYNELSLSELEDELVALLQVDSIVCSAKYESFFKAFRGLLWMLPFATFGFMGNQFWVV